MELAPICPGRGDADSHEGGDEGSHDPSRVPRRRNLKPGRPQSQAAHAGRASVPVYRLLDRRVQRLLPRTLHFQLHRLVLIG